MNFPDLRIEAKKHADKLKRIKLFLADVDGCLTNGMIYWASEEVGFNRFFNALDGYGIRMLQRSGKVKVGVLSGGGSLGLKKRIENLDIDLVSIGNEDKRQGYLKVVERAGVKDEEVLYIGDEFFDLPILKRVGFSATTAYASHEIKDIVDYVTYRDPGAGCVREVVDMLRYAQGIEPDVPDFD